MTLVGSRETSNSTTSQAGASGVKSVRISPTRSAGSDRIKAAQVKSQDKFKEIAKDDAKFEDFVFALTGKTAEQRTPAENKALKQLRQEMREGKVDPEFAEATPANGSGPDRLPAGVRGAYVSGGDGAQGRVLISGNLRGNQLQKTADEEQGEAVADRAAQLGIDVADGDAGARVSGVANGTTVTKDSNPRLFTDQASDSAAVVSNGQVVEAETQQTETAPKFISNQPVEGWVAGSDGQYYDLSTTEGQRAHAASFDADNDGNLNGDEFESMMNSIDPDMNRDRSNRMMMIYGWSNDNKDFYVPVGVARNDNPQAYVGTGTDQIYADGVITSDPSGGYATNLAEVDPATLASACLRYYAVIKWNDEGSPPGGLEGWITQYQANGLTYKELESAVGAVTGDTQPLSVHDRKHAKTIVNNFGHDVDGRQGVGFDGLTQAFGRGGIKIEGDGDHFIGLSINDKVVGADTMLDTNPGDSSALPRDVPHPAAALHAYLWTAVASQSENEQPLGVYAPPHFRGSKDNLFTTGFKNYALPASSMTRTDNGDGTVTWTIQGPEAHYWKRETESITVDAGSKQDRYLQDYKAFASGPEDGQRNRPSPNLSKGTEVAGLASEKVELWMPREHQFEENPSTSSTASTYTAPMVTVDGVPAEVTKANPVMLPDGTITYHMTVKTDSGEVYEITKTPTNDTEKAALQNLNAQVNGGNGLPVPTAVSDEKVIALALEGMPPHEAAPIIDEAPLDQGGAILLAMQATVRNAAMAAMNPSELADILEAMPPEQAAQLLNEMPTELAAEVVARIADADPGETQEQAADKAANIVAHMEPDKAVAAIEQIDEWLNDNPNARTLSFIDPVLGGALVATIAVAIANISNGQKRLNKNAREITGTLVVAGAVSRNELNGKVPSGVLDAAVASVNTPEKANAALGVPDANMSDAEAVVHMQAAETPQAANNILMMLPPERRANVVSQFIEAGPRQLPMTSYGLPPSAQKSVDAQHAQKTISMLELFPADQRPAIIEDALAPSDGSETRAVISKQLAENLKPILLNLGAAAAAKSMAKMSPENAAMILMQMDPEEAAAILAAMEPEKAAAIINAMTKIAPAVGPGFAADALVAMHGIDEGKAARVMSLLANGNPAMQAAYNKVVQELTPEEHVELEEAARVQPGEEVFVNGRLLEPGEWRPTGDDLARPYRPQSTQPGRTGSGQVISNATVENDPNIKKKKRKRKRNAQPASNGQVASAGRPVVSTSSNGNTKITSTSQPVSVNGTPTTLTNTAEVVSTEQREVRTNPRSSAAETRDMPTSVRGTIEFDAGSATRGTAGNTDDATKVGNWRNGPSGPNIDPGVNDGGHLAPFRFFPGVPNELIVPQDANLNQGAFRQFESRMASWVNQTDQHGGRYTVQYQTDIVYHPNSVEPKSFRVRWEVTDSKGNVVEHGDKTFHNDAGETFNAGLSPSEMDHSTVKPIARDPNFFN